MRWKMALAFALLGGIWGSNFLYMKMAAVWISPLQIVFLRVACGFAPVAAYAWLSGSLKREHWRYAGHFLVMGLLATAVYYYAYAVGAEQLPSGVAGLLSGSIPLFSCLCAALFLKTERIDAKVLLSLLLGFAGIVLIAQPWRANGEISHTGVTAMLLGSMSVGASFVYAKKFLAPLQLPALALATYQIGLALIILAIVTPFAGMSRILSNARALTGLIVGLGFLGTGGAFILYYVLVQRLGAMVASSATFLPPVVALLVGYWFANETLGWLQWGACALILAGVVLLQYSQYQSSHRVRLPETARAPGDLP